MLYFGKWKIATILVVLLGGLIFTIPNFVPREAAKADLPDWWQPITLGLDLRGGSYLLLEADIGVVLAEHQESLLDGVRQALREARIGYRGLGIVDNAVRVEVTEASQVDAARAALREVDPEVAIEQTDNIISLRFTEQAVEQRRANAMQQSIEIVRRRIDEFGTAESSIQAQGDNRIIVELPGIDDPGRIKALIGTTAKLTFHLLDTSASAQEVMATGRVPPGSFLAYETADNGQRVPYVLRRRVEVAGDSLLSANTSFQNGSPVVQFRFDSTGGARFARITRENVGRQFAIVLDNEIISAPRIREPIVGGSGIIEGGFTTETAEDLAVLLRAGALPAPLTIIEERTVGPGLGADSIRAGATAAVLGLVLIIIFMVIAYGLFGIVANLALLANVVVLLGALGVAGVTLTLPGIAGIVLTMGMAVDANVLIFERMKEERRNGRSLLNSIEAGFRQAFGTIVDSNITTFAAALFLFIFGSGPVRGFAVTLGFGIITSMFTAVMVTRLLVVLWLRRTRPQTLPI